MTLKSILDFKFLLRTLNAFQFKPEKKYNFFDTLSNDKVWMRELTSSSLDTLCVVALSETASAYSI